LFSEGTLSLLSGSKTGGIMGKSALWLSLIAIAVVGFGVILAPQSSLFWLATGGPVYQHVRIVIAAVLAIQLVTNPPRHVWFRIFAASLALLTSVWTIEQTYSYHMQLLDTLAFLSASFGIFATTLEHSVAVDKEYVIPAREQLVS
jgi:hypothetical protein